MDPRERATTAALADPDGFAFFRKVALTKARKMDVPFTVETAEGTMDGKAGDYLCLDTKVNAYPCAADVFRDSYAPYDPEGEGG